jgi:hypothetical protein
MALNSSGPISLGGATAGQSINLELGQAATATASINAANFRALAAVPSGQISLSNFYGKSSNTYWVAKYGSIQAGQTMAGPSGSVYFLGRWASTNKLTWCAVNGDTTTAYTRTTSGSGGSSIPPSAAFYSSSADRLLSIGSEYNHRIVASTGTYSAGNTVGTYQQQNGYASGFGSNLYSAGILIYNTCYGSDEYGYVFSFSSGGSVNWGRRASTSNSTYARAVASDGSGNLYVAGVSLPSYRPTVWKFNSSGTFQFSNTQALTTSGYGAFAIAVNSAGTTIYTLGRSSSNVGVLTKWNSTGVVQWSVSIGGSNGIFLGSICTDTSDNVYVLGEYSYTGSGTPMLFAKFNSSGTLQFQRNIQFNTEYMRQSERANCLVSDGQGGIVFSCNHGSFTPVVLFGKLPEDGSKTGTYTMPSFGTFTYSTASFTMGSLTSSSGGSVGNDFASFSFTVGNYTPSLTVSTGPTVNGLVTL